MSCVRTAHDICLHKTNTETIQRAAESGDRDAAKFLEQHENRLPDKFLERYGRMTDTQRVNSIINHWDAQKTAERHVERAAKKANTKTNTRGRNGGRGAR